MFGHKKPDSAARILGRGTTDRFKLIDEFEVVVPMDYVHATCLSDLARDFGHMISPFYPVLTDDNYRNVTTRMEPGERFVAKIFHIVGLETSFACLGLLDRERAILAGAQGLALVFRVAKDRLPPDLWTVSFDRPDALFFDSHNGCHRVPTIGPSRQNPGKGEFHSGFFEPFEGDKGWDARFCLLCLVRQG